MRTTSDNVISALQSAAPKLDRGSARIFIDAASPHMTQAVLSALSTALPADSIRLLVTERFSVPSSVIPESKGVDIPAGTYLAIDPKTNAPDGMVNFFNMGLASGFSWVIGGKSTLGYLVGMGLDIPNKAEYFAYYEAQRQAKTDIQSPPTRAVGLAGNIKQLMNSRHPVIGHLSQLITLDKELKGDQARLIDTMNAVLRKETCGDKLIDFFDSDRPRFWLMLRSSCCASTIEWVNRQVSQIVRIDEWINRLEDTNIDSTIRRYATWRQAANTVWLSAESGEGKGGSMPSLNREVPKLPADLGGEKIAKGVPCASILGNTIDVFRSIRHEIPKLGADLLRNLLSRSHGSNMSVSTFLEALESLAKAPEVLAIETNTERYRTQTGRK